MPTEQGAMQKSNRTGFRRAPKRLGSSDQAGIESMTGVCEVCKQGLGEVGAAPGTRSQCENILKRSVFASVKGG